LAAPRELVFAAWTQPKHLKAWSAPNGFTIPVAEGDVRVGGEWRACMVTPQGEKLWLGGVYRQVVKNRKLVFTHSWEGEEVETIVAVRFLDHPRGTKMIFTQTGFDSAGSMDGHKSGWAECFGRLQEYVGTAEARNGRRQSGGRKSVR
jgi:uncharacterized protein YndB with AHSA1/START domain